MNKDVIVPQHRLKMVTVDICSKLTEETVRAAEFEQQLRNKRLDLKPNVEKEMGITKIKRTDDTKIRSFYTTEVKSLKPGDAKPWKKQAHYFQTVHIAISALIKMTVHARLGGPLEIMGMMTGKYIGNDLVVLDSFPLPVHGTESRVNPLDEAYEFMLSYIEQEHKSGLHPENIIGWYHSHPGFGCWLSGIDVKTQLLNQTFQDPYVAIIIDPEQTASLGKVSIGAFRAYYPNARQDEKIQSEIRHGVTNRTEIKDQTRHEQLKDYGFHANQYYALNVSVFCTDEDQKVLSNMGTSSWFSALCGTVKSNDAVDIEELSRLNDHVSREINSALRNNEYRSGTEMERTSSSSNYRRQVSAISSPMFGASDGPGSKSGGRQKEDDEYRGALLTQHIDVSAVSAMQRYLADEALDELFG